MKILHCIDTLSIGGAERVAVDVCNLLSKKNTFYIELLITNNSGELQSELSPRIKVKELKFYSKTSIIGWKLLIESLKGFDIIHVHMRHTYGRIKIACLLAGIKTPIVFHDHFGDININKKIPFYFKGILKPRFYVGVSNELRNWGIHNLRIPKENTWTLANTIFREPIEGFSDKESKELILVSNLRETKNIEFAIKIAKTLNIKLDIYGQIISANYYQKLKALTKDSHIEIITNKKDIFQFLSKYKLAIHTAKSETGPLVILEYLKNGTSFITFDTGEVVNQIRDDFPNLILQDFEETNWQKAIIRALKNPVNKLKLKKVFEQKFSPNKYLIDLLKIYKCIEAN